MLGLKILARKVKGELCRNVWNFYLPGKYGMNHLSIVQTYLCIIFRLLCLGIQELSLLQRAGHLYAKSYNGRNKTRILIFNCCYKKYQVFNKQGDIILQNKHLIPLLSLPQFRKSSGLGSPPKRWNSGFKKGDFRFPPPKNAFLYLKDLSDKLIGSFGKKWNIFLFFRLLITRRTNYWQIALPPRPKRTKLEKAAESHKS